MGGIREVTPRLRRIILRIRLLTGNNRPGEERGATEDVRLFDSPSSLVFWEVVFLSIFDELGN